MPLIEKGTLPDGVEIDGAVVRAYELREQLVRDSVEVHESADADRANASDTYFTVCVMAKRLELSGVSREKITTELVMNMTMDDFNELAAAGKRLEEKRRTFRGAAKAAPPAADSTVEAGV